jgi:hypothetical protein
VIVGEIVILVGEVERSRGGNVRRVEKGAEDRESAVEFAV